MCEVSCDVSYDVYGNVPCDAFHDAAHNISSIFFCIYYTFGNASLTSFVLQQKISKNTFHFFVGHIM